METEKTIDEQIAEAQAENAIADAIAAAVAEVKNGKSKLWDAVLDDPEFRAQIAKMAALRAELEFATARLAAAEGRLAAQKLATAQ